MKSLEGGGETEARKSRDLGGDIAEVDRALSPVSCNCPVLGKGRPTSPHTGPMCAGTCTEPLAEGGAGWGAGSPGLALQQGGAGSFC